MDNEQITEEVVDTESVSDTSEARQYEFKRLTSNWLNKNISPILALTATLATFTIFGFLLFKAMPAGVTRDISIFVLGALTSNLNNVYSFYFGSSKGSEAKQDTLHDILTK